MAVAVTTPHGSRAQGFWIDAGMSSHTVVRCMHTSETWLKQLVYRMAQQTSARSCFYRGERFTREPLKHD